MFPEKSQLTDLSIWEAVNGVHYTYITSKIKEMYTNTTADHLHVTGFYYPLGMVATITVISFIKYASNGFISVG